MNISNDDEREAREWLQNKADHKGHPYSDKCRTILALLDVPRLPLPSDVSDYALQAMLDAWYNDTRGDGNFAGMRAAYRALYDALAQPAEPVVAWGVYTKINMFIASYPTKLAAEHCANRTPGSRIVKLVEAADE